MKTLLHVRSSLFGDQGQSAVLAAEFVSAWQSRHPGARVIVRDLIATPLPHLDADRFGALISKPETRTGAQQAIVAESDALIAELQEADEIVLAAPMYNFTVPSQLKSWFDHIARAGVTFRYTASGAEGLLGGKPVTVIATRGGFYAGTPADSQTSWLQTMLGFLGLTDVKFIYAEGIAISADHKAEALRKAREQLAAA
ncbi:MAG: FMN-dependent NADH-azoreductase [Steroidobacteraceae bacterium]